MTRSEGIPRRALFGTPLDTSVLAMRIDPAPSAAPEQDRRMAEGVRRAWEAGVTTFDLARVPSWARAASILLTAVPEPDPRLRVLVAAPGDRPSATGAGALKPTPDSGSATSGDVLRALGRVGSLLAETDLESAGPVTAEDRLRPLGSDAPDAWPVVRWSPGRAGGAPNVDPSDPVSADFSLLEPGLLSDESAPLREAHGRVIARNPFADGRLDGSRFSLEIRNRAPTARPVDVRALHAEFDPVLRLAPLTRDRRRTLAQAALQYVLFWPWIATAVLPTSSLERWSEIHGTFAAPPLTVEELSALDLVPRRRPVGSRPPS